MPHDIMIPKDSLAYKRRGQGRIGRITVVMRALFSCCNFLPRPVYDRPYWMVQIPEYLLYFTLSNKMLHEIIIPEDLLTYKDESAGFPL